MYIVVNKLTGFIEHENPAPESQGLTGTDVYFDYDEDMHIIVNSLPEHYKMVDGVPVEMDLLDKVTRGIIKISEDEKIVDGQIFLKAGYERLSHEDYKKFKISELSERCKKESQKIFPIEKQINVIIGANDNYPVYLKGDEGKTNLKRFIEIYKGIFKVNEDKINRSANNAEIEVIVNSIIFPGEAEILAGLGM